MTATVIAEEKTGGRFFEIVLNEDQVSGEVFDRPAVGRLAHEGIDIDTEGNIYVVDDGDDSWAITKEQELFMATLSTDGLHSISKVIMMNLCVITHGL